MKFTDIPALTKAGSYQANMPLRYLKNWLINHEEELGLDLNPDFQRGHVWTREQQIAYVEFLLRGGKSGRTIYFNHPSWMCEKKVGYNDFVCVDGLQRLTAVFKFLDDEIPAFGNLLSEFEDKLPFDIDLLLNINNLQTKKEVLTWYLEMNDGGTPHSADEIKRVRKLLEDSAE